LAPIPSDPVICWPPEPSLRAIIDDLRRLNPRLELRSETAVQGYEYLLHSGTSNDVLRIAFPQAVATICCSRSAAGARPAQQSRAVGFDFRYWVKTRTRLEPEAEERRL